MRYISRDFECTTFGCPEQGAVENRLVEIIARQEVTEICRTCHFELSRVLSAPNIGRNTSNGSHAQERRKGSVTEIGG